MGKLFPAPTVYDDEIVVDWDVGGDFGSNSWDWLGGTTGRKIMRSTYNGMYVGVAASTASPLTRWDFDAWGDFLQYATTIDAADPNNLAADGCALLEWEFNLTAGETKELYISSLAGDNDTELVVVTTATVELKLRDIGKFISLNNEIILIDDVKSISPPNW